MTAQSAEPLTIRLASARVDAVLEVDPPAARPHVREFSVLSAGGGYRMVQTQVLYTAARCVRSGGESERWQLWHVKAYECLDALDAVDLERHFEEQAALVQRANDAVGGARTAAFGPPWVIVPMFAAYVGGAESAEARSTRLGHPVETFVGAGDHLLPQWFSPAGRPDRTLANYLLVVSPHIEHVHWGDTRKHPGVEQITGFSRMAVSLDALHHQRIIHCDINPSNVCRYAQEDDRGYVLIDGDAVVALDRPEVDGLRLKPEFAHPELRNYRRSRADYQRSRRAHMAAGGAGNPPQRPRPPGGLDQVLRAHDRMGFVLVVLASLAGEQWVRQFLLTEAPDGRRSIDRPGIAADRLRQLWASGAAGWEPLIHLLTSPFDDPRLGDADWSASRWLAAVEGACTPRPPAPPTPTAFPGDVRAIQQQVIDRRPLGYEAPDVVRAVVADRIVRLAVGEARVTAGRWILTSLGMAVFVVLVAILMGQL